MVSKFHAFVAQAGTLMYLNSGRPRSLAGAATLRMSSNIFSKGEHWALKALKSSTSCWRSVHNAHNNIFSWVKKQHENTANKEAQSIFGNEGVYWIDNNLLCTTQHFAIGNYRKFRMAKLIWFEFLHFPLKGCKSLRAKYKQPEKMQGKCCISTWK